MHKSWKRGGPTARVRAWQGGRAGGQARVPKEPWAPILSVRGGMGAWGVVRRHLQGEYPVQGRGEGPERRGGPQMPLEASLKCRTTWSPH